MKKILGIVVIGLLLSGNVYAGWLDKDKIKVEDCYDPKKYKNIKQKIREAGDMEWAWEIDLKRDTAILSFTTYDGKLQLIKHKIKIKTDRYIIASSGQRDSADVQFDLKNEVYISEHSQSVVDALGESHRRVLLQCNFK